MISTDPQGEGHVIPTRVSEDPGRDRPDPGWDGLCLCSSLWERLLVPGEDGLLFALDRREALMKTALPELVVRSCRARSAPVIAFTCNEPTVFLECMTDLAREAKRQGLRSILSSCGIMNEAPLKELCETLDAIMIDMKGHDESMKGDCS